MGAVGYTTGDPNKVDVAGDTMTGDLILSGATTDLTVGGVITDTYQGITGDVSRLLSTALSTGITAGGTVTRNAIDNTKFDVEATEGWIVDYDVSSAISATNPRLTYVSYPGAVAVALTGPPTQQLTFLMINPAGALVQQATAPTRAQYRQNLVLSFVASNLGIIAEIRSVATMQSQLAVEFYDLGRAMGAFSVSSQENLIRPNGVNLMINNTGGGIFFPGSNRDGNYQDPHVTVLTPQTPAIFNRMTATTVLPAVFNTIDVANYDPGGAGIITPVPGGSNTSTIHRVYGIGAADLKNELFVQYGQSTYASLTAARDAIGTGTFIANPSFSRQALLAWIVVTKSATDLSNTTQALFVRAQKFASP